MSNSLEDNLDSQQASGEGEEEEDSNKPKQAIIIPQKGMKSPLDVVNTYPSKFQNGTFKAHSLEESDNEESDTNTNGSGSVKHSSYHKQSSSSSSSSKQTHKKVEEARKAASQAKGELNLLKIKQDLQTLRTNELLAQLFHAIDVSYSNISQDDQLKENFSLLLSVYAQQKDEYNKLMFPSSTEQAKIPTAHESVMEAEFLVEKTLENFEEEQGKQNDNPLGLRVYPSEIALKEKQLEHMQEQLDIDSKQSMSQSSLSDDYPVNSNVTVEEENAQLKEQNQFLKITAENIKKQLSILQGREASYDLQDSQIQELRSILAKQNGETLSDKQVFDAKVAERLQLTQRLNRLEKKVKFLSTENGEIKNSLKVFSLENLKLEKKLEIEKKSNEMLFGFTNGDESDLINGLNQQVEKLKEQVSDLLKDKDTLQMKVLASEEEINFIKSNGHSRELDTMEEDFDKQEDVKKDQWNLKMIQAKSMVLEERQNIEQEKKDIMERIAKISDEKEELQKQNENLLRDNSQSKICYKTVEKQFKDAVKENDKLKKKQSELEEKSKKLAELQEETENLQEQLKELETLKKEKENFQKEQQLKEKELEEIKKSFADVEIELTSAKKLSSETTLLMQQQKQQLLEQTQQPSSVQQEQETSDDQSKVAELQAELEDKIKQIHQIELQKQSYQNENTTFKSTYKRLEKQLRKSIKEKEALRKELEHEKQLFVEQSAGGDQRVLEILKKEIKTLTEERDEVNKRNAKLEGKMKTLTQEASMKKMENEFDEQVQEKIEKAKSQVIQEKQVLETEKSEISKKLEDTVLAKNLLQIKSEAILSENQAFHQNLSSIQKQLKAALKERDAATQERNNIKQEIAEKDSEIEKLNEEVKALNEKLEKQAQDKSNEKVNNNDDDDDDEMDHSLLIQQKDKVIAEKESIIEDMMRVKQQLDTRAMIAERELLGKSKELEEVKNQLQNKITELESKSQELEGNKNLEKFEEEFDEKEKAQSSNVEEKLKEIVQQKSRVELENAGTKENYKALEKEFRRQLKMCDELRKKLSESDEKCKELEDKNVHLEERSQELCQEKDEAVKQLKNQKQAEQQQPQQYQQPQSQGSQELSEDTRLMVADLKLENQALLIEQNMLKNANEKLENENNQLREEMKMEDMDQEFEDETKAAATLIEEKDKVIDQLHKSTTAISQENTGLKSTFKSLEKELRRQVKECDEGKKALKKMESEKQAIEEKLAEYETKYGTINAETQEAESTKEAVGNLVNQNTLSTESAQQFEELKVKYETMLREQEEFTRVQMLEFEEKEHQMEISKSEIEQEKNDLERKANSITQEQSQQKLFYASLEKQFRRFIKDSDVLKKQVNVLQKFKGKIEELVSVLQLDANNVKGGESQQMHDQGDSDTDVDDDRLLQYDILGLVRKQIADLENSKQVQQECQDSEERLKQEIEEMQGRQQEQAGKSQKLEDAQNEIARLQREREEYRNEAENGLKKANSQIEEAKQELNAAQEKLASANQRLKEKDNELIETKQEKQKSQGSERQNVEALTKELSKYQGEAKELGDKSRQSNDRVRELEKTIAGLEEQKQQQQRVVIDKENQINELQLKLNEQSNHSKELQEQLSQQEQKSTHSLQGQENTTKTATPLKSIDQSEECRRLKQRLAEKESRVGEIEKKLSELVQRIDEQNKEINEQYNIIEVLQKTGEDNEDDTPGIIAELEVEKRICDQYREQCEIIKRKCDILEAANADLTEKLRKREEKLTAQMAQLRTLNAQLIKQNELLKDDRQAMIADLEGLMLTKESLVQNQQMQQQQQQMYPKHGGQDGSGNQQSRKPKSTTDLYDEEMNYNSNSKQAKIKNKIYEFNQKVFDDVDPQLFEQGQQQPFEENDQHVLEDNDDSLYTAKLARLEDEFHKEVQSLKSIIKSKETEIVQLKVKEQIQQRKQQSSSSSQSAQQQPNSQLLTPREKKSKQNSSPSRKAIPAKIDTNNTSNNMEHFTNTNEYGIERRSKNHSAQQLQQQQQQQIQNQQMLQYQQQQQQLKPISQQQQVDAQRRHKQQQHQIQQQQQQQLLQLSTAAINQSASSALERQRKSMPQMQFVSGMQQGKANVNTSNIVGNSGLVLGNNNNNNSTNSSSSSTINNISPGDLNNYNIDVNSHNHYSTQSNKNIRSNNQMGNVLQQPGNVSAHSFTNINNNNSSGTGNNNNSFLDQMYLKCIERSKNLLHKNETLLRSLKAPNLMASPVQQQQQAQLTTATSILANQAKIQANQDQLHSAIMQTTSVKTPVQQQQQQQQLIISPSQSVHNSCAVDSLSQFQWKQQQPSSPQEHYFPNKQQQEQQQQQLQYAGSASAAQVYSNSGKNSKTMRSPMSSGAAPLVSPQQNQMLSPISPVKLDYAKLIPQGSEQQFAQGQQGLSQQPQLNGGNSNTSKNSNNFNQVPASSSTQVPRYEGDLLGNSRDGTGCYFYTNGEIYEGEWKQDKRHGYGILKDEFGIDIYNGEWAYDTFDGQGRLRNRFMQLVVQAGDNSKPVDYSNIDALVRSWQFYSGEFKNNLMHGQGTLLLGNNEKFIGQFENGRINGEGQYYSQNGEVITAIWNGQRLVQNAAPIVGTKSNNNIRY